MIYLIYYNSLNVYIMFNDSLDNWRILLLTYRYHLYLDDGVNVVNDILS